MKHLGIDIGSTTVKIAVLSPTDNQLLYTKYVRHYSLQVRTIIQLLDELRQEFPSDTFKVAICGSGGKPVAKKIQVPFIQEVVANAAAVCYLYPETRTAIELGGQDAKVIFFHQDEHDGQLKVSDMRMNGNCAGAPVPSLMKSPSYWMFNPLSLTRSPLKPQGFTTSQVVVAYSRRQISSPY